MNLMGAASTFEYSSAGSSLMNLESPTDSSAFMGWRTAVGTESAETCSSWTSLESIALAVGVVRVK